MKTPQEIVKGPALTNAVDNATLARHRWYPIKEGFSAKLISDSIDKIEKTDRKRIFVIEPFSGSGTTPVECTRLGVDCLALEVNPFLAFVGRTKLRQIEPKALRREREHILRGLGRPAVSPLENLSTFCETPGREKSLFNREVLRSFTGGWEAVPDCASPARAFLRLALIRAAMDNCNAYPDGKCLRYKRLKNYRQFNREALASRFETHCDNIEEDLKSTPFSIHGSAIECMDSRKLRGHRSRRHFDLCITSPPYLNSFDYSDVYRPELFLAGYVHSNDQLMKIRLSTIRSHVHANWQAPVKSKFGTIYDKILKELVAWQDNLWSARIPLMVQAYFEDMECLLSALARRAKPGAELKIAVATSAYAGVVVPVDLILADIAEGLDWELHDIDVIRRLRSSGQLWHHESESKTVPELRESLVVLNRSKAKKTDG